MDTYREADFNSGLRTALLIMWVFITSLIQAATFTVTNVNNTGAGSLRKALSDANSNGTGLDNIHFNIPGSGVHTVTLTSQLPIISSSLNVDGSTQVGYSGSPLILIDGNAAVADGLSFLNSGNNTIKALAIGNCNSNGIFISGGAGNNSIRSCTIGTDPTGMFPFPNGANGISIVNNGGNQIGGAALYDTNIISANLGNGVSLLGGSCSNNTVEGNFIGTNPSGDDLGNKLNGIRIIGGSNNVIGGVLPAASNVIAYNEINGLLIYANSSTPLNNSLIGNSVYMNTALGIDLGNDGISTNDAMDTDGGSNGTQNFPVIELATSDGSNTTVSGLLSSTANREFRIEIFTSSTFDPSGYGEGELFVLSTNVMTDGSGNASFSISTPSIPGGEYVSATATRVDAGIFKSTSEFSASRRTVSLEICANGIDDDGDGKVDSDDPECLDCDGDGVFNTDDPDDDNDGILDLMDGGSSTGLFDKIGEGNSVSAPFDYHLYGMHVSGTSNFDVGECYVYDGGLQGHGLRVQQTVSGASQLTFSFDRAVTNLTFKAVDMDQAEKFSLVVYDENGLSYDLDKEGVVGLGSYITQSGLRGERFTAQNGPNVPGLDPADDPISSIIFHFPGKVSSVEFDIETGAGNSMVLTEMEFNFIDHDEDGVLGPCDLDSDNDGIYDVDEADGPDPDYDGIVGAAPFSDPNGNGLSNVVDTDEGGFMMSTIDSDSDGVDDLYDLDSDNDGCSDVLEAGHSDSDSDGRLGDSPVTVDAIGVVTSAPDGYVFPTHTIPGIADALDGSIQTGCPDQDSDLVMDANDIDDDNDGLLDVVESGEELAYERFGWSHNVSGDFQMDDTTHPSVLGWFLTSAEDETFHGVTGVIGAGGSSAAISDIESIDLQAAISSGEYIEFGFKVSSEVIEPSLQNITSGWYQDVAGESILASAAISGDGFITSQWLSTDVPIYRDPSAYVTFDMMTIPGGLALRPEVDYTVRVYVYSQSDDDPGIDNSQWDDTRFLVHGRRAIDTDLDAVKDHLDLDSDNDGLFDALEAGGLVADPDFNGIIGTGPSATISDSDDDGWSDIVDGDDGGVALMDPDVDTDGKKNRIDDDSDGDGCTDVIEAGFPDADGDGQLGGVSPPTTDDSGVVTSGGL